MKAHTLSLNEFNMPQVFDDTNAGYVQIVRLLLLEPGKNQSHPTMGVGLRSKYRHNNDDNFLIDLKSNIESQINSFLPELSAESVQLVLKDHTLGIIIDTASGTYVIGYNTATDAMDVAATYVLDQL